MIAGLTDWLIDWLIDWMVFYAASVIFQPYNGGLTEEHILAVGIFISIFLLKEYPTPLFLKKGICRNVNLLNWSKCLPFDWNVGGKRFINVVNEISLNYSYYPLVLEKVCTCKCCYHQIIVLLLVQIFVYIKFTWQLSVYCKNENCYNNFKLRM